MIGINIRGVAASTPAQGFFDRNDSWLKVSLALLFD